MGICPPHVALLFYIFKPSSELNAFLPCYIFSKDANVPSCTITILANVSLKPDHELDNN